MGTAGGIQGELVLGWDAFCELLCIYDFVLAFMAYVIVVSRFLLGLHSERHPGSTDRLSQAGSEQMPGKTSLLGAPRSTYAQDSLQSSSSSRLAVKHVG